MKFIFSFLPEWDCLNMPKFIDVDKDYTKRNHVKTEISLESQRVRGGDPKPHHKMDHYLPINIISLGGVGRG